MKVHEKPVAIIPDKFGPDMILAYWKDEAKKLVVRGGLSFPRDSGPVDSQGFVCVLVRGVEPSDQRAHVVFESFWNAVDPVFDEDKLLDAGLTRMMSELRGSWGVERFAHFENETDVNHFTRQIRRSTLFHDQPPMFRRAEYGSDREGWGLIWNWLRRGQLMIKKGGELHRIVTASKSQSQIPLGNSGMALASALWNLDRRGVRIDKEARVEEDHWRFKTGVANE